MSVLAISNFISVSLALIFTFVAAVHLYRPRFLQNTYRHCGYRDGLPRIVGVLLVTSAIFLFVPQTRIWGGILSGMITFAAVAVLLRHGRFAWAAPGILILAALPVAMTSGFLA